MADTGGFGRGNSGQLLAQPGAFGIKRVGGDDQHPVHACKTFCKRIIIEINRTGFDTACGEVGESGRVTRTGNER